MKQTSRQQSDHVTRKGYDRYIRSPFMPTLIIVLSVFMWTSKLGLYETPCYSKLNFSLHNNGLLRTYFRPALPAKQDKENHLQGYRSNCPKQVVRRIGNNNG